MKDVLDDELHQHYSLLVGGIYLLSGTSISPEQLEKAGELLIHFVEMFHVYYGEPLNIRVGEGNSTVLLCHLYLANARYFYSAESRALMHCCSFLG